MDKYNKEWYYKLNEQINCDKKLYNNVDYLYFKNIINSKIKYSKKHCIIKFINNKYTLYKCKNTIDNENRYNSIKILLNKMIKYINYNNLNQLNGIFIFRIADGYDYEYDIPTICYAKPINKKSFLYPDFNFHRLENKKKKFNKYCNNINKINKIYFKGNSTSHLKTQIREKMTNLKHPFKIDISNKSIPYYHICNYKYLLDLPGYKPWSVRLIELYLSRSLPIRIIFYNSKWNEKPWIQFYEKMFNLSSINIKYDINYDREIKNIIINEIHSKIILIYNKIEKNNNLYNKIVNTNYEKTMSLSEDHISFYMYKMLNAYNDLITK